MRGYLHYCCRHCSRAIFVPLLVIITLSAQAQTYFNRLYPNHSKAMILEATCPQGSSSFMAAAMVVDSATGKDGLRFFRFDAEGKEQASSFFAIPRFKDRYFVLFPNCMARINDNSFVVLAQVQSDAGAAPIAALTLIDSNAQIKRYEEVYNPRHSSRDSFMSSNGVGFDGEHIVSIHNISVAAGRTLIMLMKFDTTLKMIWNRTYAPGIYTRHGAGAICVTKDAYTLIGFADNSRWDDDTAYRSQTVVVKTDTSGAVLWEYRNPEFISDGPACIVQTSDGGYVFTAKGNVRFGSGTFKRYVGQEKLFKLSGYGEQQWEQVLFPDFNGIGEVTTQIAPDKRGNFRVFGLEEDTVGDFWIGCLNTRLYDTSGKLLKKQKYYSPYVRDTTYKVRLGFFGPCYTEDNHALISGCYEDYSGRVITPQQQGWIIKLDTNGCLGPLDSFCAPVAVSERQAPDRSVSIHPNPARGSIYLELAEALQGLWIISDIQGRVIREVPLTSGLHQYSCDLGSAAPGLYYYRLISSEGIQWEAGKLMYQP